MNGRRLRLTGFLIALGAIVLVAVLSQAQPVSTYSTFDTGVNGYQAMYDVLRDERVQVQRLQQPLGLRSRDIRVIAATSTAPELRVGSGLLYDANDYKRLAQFVKSGGFVIYFAAPVNDPMLGQFRKNSVKVTVLDATRFTNLALSKRPQNIRQAYDILAGRGPVAFDERLHGYAIDQTMWSVLPWAVRGAFWIVILAVLIALVDANIAFAPAPVRETPQDRNSSAYIASMAALLKRAHAPHRSVTRKEGV